MSLIYDIVFKNAEKSPFFRGVIAISSQRAKKEHKIKYKTSEIIAFCVGWFTNKILHQVDDYAHKNDFRACKVFRTYK